MKVRFWGTRGSIPTPDRDRMKYGGNTSCVQVTVDNNDTDAIILDAGTGIRQLGIDLMNRFETMKVYLFLTHFHWDHIQGIPFFAPLYSEKFECTFVGCDRKDGNVEKKLKDSVCPPYFPVGFDVFKAKVNYIDICEGDLSIGGATVCVKTIHHPGGAITFKIMADDTIFVFMTDNELDLSGERKDFYDRLVAFCKGADVLVHDAQYTPDEYASKRGWGHSSYVDAVHFALDGGVKRLVLFHHDPEHNDEKIDDIVEDCHTILSEKASSMECVGAWEGIELKI